ncbi:MAG TPA: HAMP domain-containing sensor histidine kinase [Chryseolinea sp.]
MARVRTLLIFVISTVWILSASAQEKQSIQVRTFDQKLQPLRNIDVSLNGKDYISVGPKGVAIVEVSTSDLPIKSVNIKDEKLEAASWDFSKGVIEIVVRQKSYSMVHFIVQFPDGTRLAKSPVSYKGSTPMTLETDAAGELDIPVPLNEKITSANQLQIPGVQISRLNLSAQGNVIIVNYPKVNKPDQRVTLQEQLNNFDMANLDSIKSITVFYAVFKNIAMKDLTAGERRRIDAKFDELVLQMEDSVARSTNPITATISDSSFVTEDIRSLVAYSTNESEVLQTNRAEFDEKIRVISNKLEKGLANFSADERQNLLSDLDLLEKLLIENEGKFYQNQSDYRIAINELREKYFDTQSLESRLSDSEKQREEEQKAYRQRFIIIAGVLIAFAALIILLISFSARLRKQAKDLTLANEEVQTINENLEAIVIKRTKLLEETNRELDTFLYRASHDLRSPIRSILGLCNIIDSIPSSELLTRMKGTTLGMDRMLKKLIYISEISQQSSNISTVQVSTSIQEVKSRLEETIRDTGVKINVECPEDITIRTSPTLLENILTNLVENAIFFSMLKDSHHAQVDIKATVKGNAMEISVYDNGVGIEEAIRPRLFDMFFTGHENSKGNGLGLYAVHKSVTALYGKVHVESEVGHYSRISVLIPHS